MVNKKIFVFVMVLLIMGITACSEKKSDIPYIERSTTSAAETETLIITETTEETTVVTEAETTKLAESVQIEEELSSDKTMKPVINGTVNTAPDEICVAGKCEEGAVITIKGGTKTVEFNADKIYFMGTTFIPASGSTILEITAKVPGKDESDPAQIVVNYKANAEHIRTDAYEVIVGLDSQGHFISSLADYEGTNLLKDQQISSLTARIQTRVNWLNDKADGAELIYLVVPSSMNMFPETVPERYKQNTGISRKDQFIEALEAGGATVIDATEALFEHKDDEYKLFHKTDSHWTEYGAWVAYTELMNYISEKWEDAKPRTFEEMGFYEKDVDGGDMPYYLTMDYSKVREVAVFSKPTFDLPVSTLKYVNSGALNMNHETTPKYKDIKSFRDNLPNAYICRDSYGIALYDMLAERFNRTIYEAMWSYSFNTDQILKADADYVIYIVAERNLGDVLF